MPIYDYDCPTCGLKENVWAEVYEEVFCKDCGLIMKRLISACNIQPDIEPRWEENIAHPEKSPHGSYITSRQHRDKLCKEYGIHITK
jgi:putative FmdB family regulatory protein